MYYNIILCILIVINILQDDDLKWVEENIPGSLYET